MSSSLFHLLNGRDSFQLFVGVFDTSLVWYLLVLPSETHSVANMTSLRAIDGDTSYHSCESFSLLMHSSCLFPSSPRSVQLEGEECPLHVKHPPTGEEFALGCGVCRNAHTF